MVRSLLQLILSALLAASCGNIRSEVRVTLVKGSPSRGGATNLQGKDWFQTREPISLKFQASLLQSGDIYSIVNRTNGKTLLDKEIFGSSLVHDLSLVNLNAAGDVVFHFYPEVSGAYEDFEYSTNAIDLVINRSGKSYLYSTSFGLRDFEVFGVASIGFDDQLSVKEGLTGWLNDSATDEGFPMVNLEAVWMTTGHANFITPGH